jgi:hypothetical protein
MNAEPPVNRITVDNPYDLVQALVATAWEWEEGKVIIPGISLDDWQVPILITAFARVTARALKARVSPATSLADIIDQLKKETE